MVALVVGEVVEVIEGFVLELVFVTFGLIAALVVPVLEEFFVCFVLVFVFLCQETKRKWMVEKGVVVFVSFAVLVVAFVGVVAAVGDWKKHLVSWQVG